MRLHICMGMGVGAHNGVHRAVPHGLNEVTYVWEWVLAHTKHVPGVYN